MQTKENSAPTSLDEHSGMSGLYVDLENLGELGQELLSELVAHWPSTVPRPGLANLYVPASQAELWQVWAEDLMKDAKVVAKGVQRFSSNASKNAADIALSADAIADFVTDRVSHVVVVSDDSDFISLYAAVRDRQRKPDATVGVPFLWVVTDRARTLSVSARKFFPDSLVHVLKVASSPIDDASDQGASKNPRITKNQQQLADTVIREMPLGKFSSTDCRRAIKTDWPDHPMLELDGPQFGIQFTNQLWPELERRGVLLVGTKPRRYEMTRAAKRSIDV